MIFNSIIQDFPKYGFKHSVYANDVLFLKSTNFNSTIFRESANFEYTTFAGFVTFATATFEQSYFNYATFLEDANFEYTTFTGNVMFASVTFFGNADFRDTTFTGNANFGSTTFKGRYAFFASVTFKGEADFDSVTFTTETYFSLATFTSVADFRDTIFTGNADFESTTFRRYADFNSAAFLVNTYFSSCTIREYANFDSVTFKGEAHFDSVTFMDVAYFDFAIFRNLAYFYKTTFNTLILDSVTFEKYADFRDTSIEKLNFQNRFPTVIYGRIDFRNAKITEAHFQDIIFEKDVDFSAAEFGRADTDAALVFRFVTFESDAYFIGTEFYCNTAFERINFKEAANFTNAEFKLGNGNIIHGLDLNMIQVKDESSKRKLIGKFKAEPQKNKHIVLIVNVTTDHNNVWTIAMFDDKGEFINKDLIEGVNNELDKGIKQK